MSTKAIVIRYESNWKLFKCMAKHPINTPIQYNFNYKTRIRNNTNHTLQITWKRLTGDPFKKIVQNSKCLAKCLKKHVIYLLRTFTLKQLYVIIWREEKKKLYISYKFTTIREMGLINKAVWVSNNIIECVVVTKKPQCNNTTSYFNRLIIVKVRNERIGTG